VEIGGDQDVEGTDGYRCVVHARFIPHSCNIDAKTLRKELFVAYGPGMAERKEAPKRPPKKPPDMDRAGRLLELMEDQGWSPTHLAKEIARPGETADPSKVYRWLNGETISSEYLTPVCEVLETTRRYLITGEGEPHKPRVIAALDPSALDRVAEHLAKEPKPPAGKTPSNGNPPADD
jgi:hypothetical protein